MTKPVLVPLDEWPFRAVTEEEMDLFRCYSCGHTLRAHRVAVIDPYPVVGVNGIVFVERHQCDQPGCGCSETVFRAG
jgi:hypothetical protein